MEEKYMYLLALIVIIFILFIRKPGQKNVKRLLDFRIEYS